MACKISTSSLSTISSGFYVESIEHYTDKELELYSDYMNEVRTIVRAKELPDKVKAEMLWGKTLYKSNEMEWYLMNEGYKVYFISFRGWMKQSIREEKLIQLGI